MHNHLDAQVADFGVRYADWLGDDLQAHPSDGLVALRAAVSAAHARGHDLYLLIDEYDNFANELMHGRRADYDALVSGEGLLKTVFKAVKSLASGAGIDRLFITGVSPVVLAYVSSGYKVSKDVSLDANCVYLVGFSEAEIAAVLDQLAAERGCDRDWSARMLDTMRTWYNGYRFGYEPGPSIAINSLFPRPNPGRV
ncbi:putative AAA-ATPase [Thiorhodovibrio winogradskyi]|uniref:AAA-ATPase n=1 Tax=Thiorhodovibrio winogradskyi TaxID=77007 RepID=A0ABZ0S4F9_9GAMM|nr:AAA family ATPase [Thiorhodovibrio winogradskyi]